MVEFVPQLTLLSRRFALGMNRMRTLLVILLFSGCIAMPPALTAATALRRIQNDHEIQAVHFSPDGSTFATMSHYQLRFWNVNTGEISNETLDARAGKFRLSRSIENGRFMLVGADGVRLYDMQQGDLVARMGSGYVKSLDYDPATKQVAALLQRLEWLDSTHYYYAMRLVVYDIEDEVDRGWFDLAWHAMFGRSAPGPELEIELPVSKTGTEDWRYNLVALRGQGAEVVVVGYPEAIVWSIEEESESRRFKTDSSGYAYAISPDGSHYITCNGRIFDVDLWSIDEGKKIASMEQPGYPQNCRFSKDGQEVLIRSVHFREQFEAVWRTADGKEVDSSEIDPEFAADETGWSEDGKTFVAVSRGGFLRLYGPDDDEPAATGSLPSAYLNADALKYDRRGDRGPAQAVYVNPSGTHAVWTVGRQGVIWSLR